MCDFPLTVNNSKKTAPLKARATTVYQPGAIEPLTKKRAKDLGYKSVSAYFVGLALFDLYCKKPHSLTGKLLNEDQETQDRAIAQLVEDFDKSESRGPDWFGHRIEEIVKGIQMKKKSPDPENT